MTEGTSRSSTAAAYIRVSGTHLAADDRHGLPRQRAEVEAYAARHGFVVGEVYSDVITGRVEGRKNLTRLLKEADRYSLVIAPSVDRIGRTVLTAHKVLEELRASGLAVHTAEDGLFDPESDSDALTYGMRALISDQELRAIKRRILGGKEKAAEAGIIPQKWAAYGYRARYEMDGARKVRHIELDETTAPIVREIYERLIAGETTMQIAEAFNARGLPSPGGKAWFLNRVWAMARNTAYKGEVRVYMTRAQREFVFPVPPIVTPDEWALAVANLKRKPRKNSSVFLLQGILKCAACDGSMSGVNDQRGRTYRHYRCGRAASHFYRTVQRAGQCSHTKNYRAEDVHEAARRALEVIAAHPDDYLRAVNVTREDDGQAARLAKDVARLQAALDRYREDYARGVLDGEDYALLKTRTSEQLAKARADLALLAVPVRADVTPLVERLVKLIRSDLPMRDVLIQSGTILLMHPPTEEHPSGRLEVKLRV